MKRGKHKPGTAYNNRAIATAPLGGPAIRRAADKPQYTQADYLAMGSREIVMIAFKKSAHQIHGLCAIGDPTDAAIFMRDNMRLTTVSEFQKIWLGLVEHCARLKAIRHGGWDDDLTAGNISGGQIDEFIRKLYFEEPAQKGKVLAFARMEIEDRGNRNLGRLQMAREALWFMINALAKWLGRSVSGRAIGGRECACC